MKTMKTAPQFSAARGQGGFTLIELVMVIVILGILSAFALPRFADVSTDARAATVKALAGSIQSAAAIAHSKVLASGGPSTGATTVTLDDLTVNIIDGYPTAHSGGIVVASAIDTTNDFTTTAGGTAAGSSVIFMPKGLSAAIITAASCQVTYTAATAGTAPATTVVPTTIGC